MNKVTAIVAGLILLATCLSAGCNRRNGEMIYEEVMRVKSPDEKVEAVLVSTVGHVIGNNSHLLYIVPAGRKYDRSDAAFGRSYLSARCFENLKLVWREAQTLEVQYQEALIDEFRNCANLTDNPEQPHVIELRLAPQGASALPSRCPCLK